MSETALFTILSSHPGLTSLVGTRIYALVAPQKVAKPYVTFQLVEGSELLTLGTDPGDSEDLYQFDCWDITNEGALAVRNELRAALKDFSGVVGGVTVDRIIGPVGKRSDYEVDTQLYRKGDDFRIFYRE